jgi:hypothetical protein
LTPHELENESYQPSSDLASAFRRTVLGSRRPKPGPGTGPGLL